jgi:hypothetical protein
MVDGALLRTQWRTKGFSLSVTPYGTIMRDLVYAVAWRGGTMDMQAARPPDSSTYGNQSVHVQDNPKN